MRTPLLLLFFISACLLLGATAHAAGFFDDFDDGSLNDGSPVIWRGSDLADGDIDANGGDMVLTPPPGENFVSAFAEHHHGDGTIETTFVAPSDRRIFLFSTIRVGESGGGSGYWGGLFPGGEIGIGYVEGSNTPVARGNVFLPTGPLDGGDEVTVKLEALDDTLTLSVWETRAGPSASAQVSWRDPLNRYPVGETFNVGITPNGSTETVRIRSVGATFIPKTGDYNGDRLVDVADYELWRDTFGSTDLAADGNGDLVVDAADYTIWRDALGVSPAQQRAPVPEPSTVCLLIAASSSALTTLRRHSA